VRYARTQVTTILPESPPRFINLNNYIWSEKWLERYRDMDFIQNVLNGMASRRHGSMPYATHGMTSIRITMR
jgi:acyl carrier protein phosphodiesterase